MSSNLQFDFLISREHRTITVKKEFAAPVEKVWAAWTESELLDQWWAPKPYKAVTKSMSFREGGSWLYAMTGPDDFRQYCRADFKSIDAMKSFSALDAFCNERGEVIEEFPRALWENSFSSQPASTLVNIVISYKELEDLEKIMEMGFKEGFTAGLDNLDELLGRITPQA